jgi:molybdopterin converting factor small subunit
MIAIRRPTIKGDKAVSLELIKGRSEIDQEFRKGNFAAVNRNDERIIIQSSEEIMDNDEVLVFPRISGGIATYC